jgi:hypothetical protein
MHQMEPEPEHAAWGMARAGGGWSCSRFAAANSTVGARTHGSRSAGIVLRQ